MPIEIANRCPAIKPDRPALTRLVRGVLRLEESPRTAITLVLATDALLRELNGRYRGLDRSTDVLSFEPSLSDSKEDSMPGEIYVSMDRVFSQASRYRHSPQRELARIIIHGVLHVLGHDHHQTAERTRMRERERACALALDSSRLAYFTPRAR